MSDEKCYLTLAIVCMAALLIVLYSVKISPARDLGQWDPNDPIVKWYKGLMQPDVPTTSCCGEADSYWADSFEQEKGQYVAIITDERDDGPLKRPHVAIGTRIVIPNNKIKWNDGNPTGHGVLFMSPHPYFYVYCYVPPGGV